MVARQGFEPWKALGRQIYSLLHLTALQSRRSCQRLAVTRLLAWPATRGRIQLARPLVCVLIMWTEESAFCDPGRPWSWRRDLNPRPADYKSAALPTELRQPDKAAIVAHLIPPRNSTTCVLGRRGSLVVYRKIQTFVPVVRRNRPKKPGDEFLMRWRTAP